MTGISMLTGNVGIATTSPSQALTVSGNSQITGTSTFGAYGNSLSSYAQTYIAGGSATVEAIGINFPTVSNTGVIQGVAETNNTGGFQPASVYGVAFANPPSGGSSALVRGGDFDVSSVGTNHAGQLAGVSLYAENTNGGMADELDGLYMIYLASNTGKTNYMYGVRIGGMDPAAIESAALKLDNQPGYAIKTGVGTVSFGDKVGIGTTSPWGRLSFTGSGTGATNDFIFADSNNSAKVVFQDNGNVGIGTTTPATKLQVSAGASATTTVTVGELGLSSSKACVNMNRANGGAGSFYISAAGTFVVESNYCR